MRNKYHPVVLSVIFIIILYAIGPRVDIDYTIQPIEVTVSAEQYIHTSEAKFSDIRPGTEKHIVWADPETKNSTEYSIVYLHGFSASRQEIAPLCDILASKLSANLFYSRLTGHGRTESAMNKATVNALLNDAVESLLIGKKIGHKVIVIGTSTGATLATWLAAQKDNNDIAALILLSPNYGLKRQESELLLYPWGKSLLNIIEGDEYSFTPVNDLQKQYWTTRYPSEALLNMMGIIEVTRNANLQDIKIPTLTFYSDKDNIVSVEKIKTQFRRLSSSNKRLVAINNSSDPQQHILAGDILSPSTTNDLVTVIDEFLSPIVNH